MLKAYFISLTTCLFSIVAMASPTVPGETADAYLANHLALLQTQPALAMSAIPPKYDSEGNRVHQTSSYFTQKEITDGRYVEIKMDRRQKGGFQFRSGIDEANSLEHFFERQVYLKNMTDLSSDEFKVGQTSVAPWSGDYYATYRGGLAARYADPEYPYSENKEDYYNYFKTHGKIDLKDQQALDNLSPAEKYDLLVGDDQFTLANWSLSELENAYPENKAETWFGLCHGWAPAAFMMARPEKAVTIHSEKLGIDLKFFPSDIKALETLLWANATLQSRTLGGRCNEKNPEKDANGRFKDGNCFDINPASWHLAVLNRLGREKNTFVMDATFDYEVWNQPVKGFRLSYFNPITSAAVNDVPSAQVMLADYEKDPFKAYRSPQAKYVVGVSILVDYVRETRANHLEADSEQYDSIMTVQYVYDLELSENGEIIGGEWYHNAHPDFVWSPYPGARAVSVADRALKEKWDSGEPPVQWVSAARLASSYGQPLAKVVEEIVRRSK